MKQIFVISLLFVMLVQPFSKVLILADYQANKEYIMAFLCINRDRPELQCEGHCYLQNKLEKQEEAEKHQDKQKQSLEIGLHLYCQDLFQLAAPAIAPQLASPTSYVSGLARQVSLLIFHPPQFLV